MSKGRDAQLAPRRPFLNTPPLAATTSSDMEVSLHTKELVDQRENLAPTQKGIHPTLTPLSATPQAFSGEYPSPCCPPELKWCATSTQDLDGLNNRKPEAPRVKKPFCFLSLFTKFLSSGRRRDRIPIECIACGDTIVPKKSFRAPCAHRYCLGCLANFAKASTRDESLYPLQCCQIRMSTERIARRLPKPLQTRFRAKSVEYSVPAATRVYCANRKCSAFICSSNTHKANMTCLVCGITTCLGCRNRRHPGEDCAEAGLQEELKTLADNKNWQSCPGCQAVVERTDGCSHITCRCATHFCYQCGARWQKCFCHRDDY